MPGSRDPATTQAPPRSPLRSGALLPARELTLIWLLLVLLAGLAWVFTVGQARGMGVEPGTMGMALPLFLALWVAMMAAMMLPSMAPVAVTWARAIARHSSGLTRVSRTLQFACGYLVVWGLFGVLAYGALALTGHLVREDPGVGRWIGVGAFAVAGLYQLGPLKNYCLRHCRDPMSQLMHYANFKPWARDLRVGAHHGAYCVGCCWGLMLALIPLGVMNIAAMAGLAAAIFVEKLWSRGPQLSRLIGVVLLACAAAAPFADWLLPGLQAAGPAMGSM